MPASSNALVLAEMARLQRSRFDDDGDIPMPAMCACGVVIVVKLVANRSSHWRRSLPLIAVYSYCPRVLNLDIDSRRRARAAALSEDHVLVLYLPES